MAAGVMYAGYLTGSKQITAPSALALSIGIAIQNFPDGAIASRQGGEKRQSVSLRRAFGRGRTYRSRADDYHRAIYHSHVAVSFKFCRRRNDLRLGGRTDSQNAAGKTLEYRHGILCRGFQRYDGFGRGFRLERRFAAQA